MNTKQDEKENFLKRELFQISSTDPEPESDPCPSSKRTKLNEVGN